VTHDAWVLLAYLVCMITVGLLFSNEREGK